MESHSPLQLGSYVLLLELTMGGMATVYVAKQAGAAGFERLVIIKRVHRHLLRMTEFRDMFLDEARVASIIRHPNVVSVDDVVESADELFLVQQYVESVTLAELLQFARKRGETLPVPVVVRIIADALAGLCAAHDARDMRGERLFVVHRDVSPHNILVGSDGRSRIIDFGIAKAARRITSTSGGVMKGKLAYMSPEQARQQPVDARADLFALGAVLHESLTGKQLFLGDDDADILLNVLLKDIPTPSALVRGVPAPLDAVVAMALEREPENRYQSSADFLEALEKAVPPAQGREVSAIVERLCGDELLTRREAVRQSLDDPPSSSNIPRMTPLPIRRSDITLTEGIGSEPGEPRSKSDITMAATQAARGSSNLAPTEAQGRSKRRLAIFVVFSLVGLLIAAALINSMAPTDPPGPASAASSVPSVSVSVSVSVPAPVSASVSAPVSASVSVSVSASVSASASNSDFAIPTSSASVKKPLQSGPVTRPTTTPTATPSTGLKPNPFL